MIGYIIEEHTADYNSEILEEIVIEIEKGSKGGGGNIIRDIFYSFLSSKK